MAGRRPETIAKREKEQARREKRERKQAKKEARALGEVPATDEVPVTDGETAEGETPLDDVQLDADVAAGKPLD
jgi:hypothetical protein